MNTNITTIQEVKVTYKRPLLSTMPRVRKSQEAEAVLRKFIDPERIDYKEFFWIILLSRSHHVLGVAQIAEGGTTSTQVNLKEIFQLIIKTNAVNFVLCHNHPSGNLQPSEADIVITRRIKEVAQILDITLLDHLIISSEGYLSFSDEGVR